MAAIGGFSEEALRLFQHALVEQFYEFSEDGEATFDFARCQRANGTFYGTAGKCRSGNEVGAKEVEAAKSAKGTPAAQKPAKLGGAKVGSEKRLLALSVSQLKQLREDPRLYDYQKKKIDSIIAKKGAEPSKKPSATPAAKAARPVDPKVAKKVDKAMADAPKKTAAQEWVERKRLLDVEKQAREYIRKKYADELGHLPSKIGPEANELHRRFKANGLMSDDAFTKAEMKLWKDEPAEIKKNRLDRAERERQEGLKMPKAERRKAIAKEIAELPDKWYGKDISSVTRSIDTLKGFMKEPTLDTIENRNKLVALRAYRMKLVRAEMEKRKALGTNAQEAVKNSPTYTKTPGATKPAPASKLGPKVQEYISKKKEEEELTKKLDKLEKLPWEERKAKGYQELDDRRSILRGELIRLERQRDFIQLSDIYKAQGYNEKPVIVATRGDLAGRDDIMKRSDGEPLILYRGVTEQKFADQLRGLGSEGGVHYPGEGIYGNGTYAAATPAGKGTNDRVAQETARDYAGSGEGQEQRVTAFAFRNDANVKTFEGATQSERFDNYAEWQRGIMQEASRRTGVPVNDTGHAAAIMGIHAYQIPQGYEEDYFVILNRGATIQAVDAQLNPV
jgi:hypothetical protein